MSSWYILNINPLSDNMICKHFIAFHRLPFHFVDSFLCCIKVFLVWCSPSCLFLPLLSLFLVLNAESHNQDRCQDAYCLWFLLVFMISGLIFKSLICFDFYVQYKVVVQFHSFVYGCPVFPTLITEHTVLSPLYIFCSFVIHWPCMHRCISGLLIPSHSSVLFLCQKYTILVTMIMKYSLSQDCFGYLGVFCGSVQILILCGAGAVSGREDLPHFQGQERQQGRDTPCPR